MQTIYKVLKWSFEALASGYYPAADHDDVPFSLHHYPERFAMRGKQLAGGFVGCFSEMRGDWKYLKEALILREHYGMGSRICHLCGVLKHSHDRGMRYTNFRRDALHRSTRIAHAHFSNRYLGFAIFSYLLLIPGFCIWRVYFDYMHTHDLGITQYVVPSVLCDLTDPQSTVFVGNTRQAKLHDAYRRYSIYCKNNRVKSVISKPFNKIVWCKSKYPRVSQNAAKAAAIRSLMYWVETITSTQSSNEHDGLRSAMVKGFVNADRVCRRAGRFLSRAQHDALCSNLESALVCYNKLASESIRSGSKRYKIVPKFHAATHQYDSRTNPRRTHCYPDEDMVGKMKCIYNACHGLTAPVRALQRYCILVGLRWWVALHTMRGLPYV